jgi:hypothetical protein
MTPDELAEEFARQAEWRSEKAEQYPDDERNAEAAAIFDRLAGSVKDCPKEVVDAALELFDDLDDSEVWQERLKRVGFHEWPDTAEAFLRSFIAERSGTAHQ